MTPNSTVLRIADRSTPKPSLNRTRQYVEILEAEYLRERRNLRLTVLAIAVSGACLTVGLFAIWSWRMGQ